MGLEAASKTDRHVVDCVDQAQYTLQLCVSNTYNRLRLYNWRIPLACTTAMHSQAVEILSDTDSSNVALRPDRNQKASVIIRGWGAQDGHLDLSHST